ncbi:MAG: flagellar export protein FliJ [bacterium]|jgi:flagellar export protein FliJ
MGLARLLKLKRQQEKQGCILLQQANCSLVREQSKLKILQQKKREAEGYFINGGFDTSMLRTYGHYLDGLRMASNLQVEQVYIAKKDAESAAHKWEGLRVEREKLERIDKRWRKMHAVRQQRLEQARLDEMAQQMAFRGAVES